MEGSVEDLTSLLSVLDKSQPDYIFHLAAQSFVERSFINPLETFQANAAGTTNLLEAMRIKDKIDSTFIFAGSSEEYGLVISSQMQLDRYLKEHGHIFPFPTKIPELPIKETNPLRPMSPYAVTKVYGEYITLNFNRSYGLRNIVARSFNHEGARRGATFVTSTIARQVVGIRYGLTNRILIGNVNAFRDWSHIDDIIEGYKLVAAKGAKGDVYNLGSERTNSVLTYILWALEEAGYEIQALSTAKQTKSIKKPAEEIALTRYGKSFRASRIDDLMLNGKIEFSSSDGGIKLQTSKGAISIEFDKDRFRPADVPLLLSDTTKAKETIGFSTHRSVKDIIIDQLNYYTAPERR